MAGIETFRIALQETRAKKAFAARRNPFVGPRPFELDEPLWGRDEEIAALYFLLCAERIVLLHAPSGAGKSSLVQAGLIPRLRGSFDVWRPTRVNQEPGVAAPSGRPFNRYVHSAILGFEEGIPRALRRPAAELAGLTLAEYAAGRPKRPGAPPSVVVIFDQLEEVLTVDPLAVEAKQEFFAQLGALLHDPQIWALFLLREDYLAPLDPYADRVPTHLKNRYRIDLLGLAAAREAIVNPAREKGREFPAAGKLVHDLATVKVQQPDGSFLEQTGSHVEPVQLQVVCHRLWDALPEDDLSIDDVDMDRFGNVHQALADYYAEAVARIAAGNPKDERAIRDWFGERLITPGGIRGQVLKGVQESEGVANDLIEQLRASHLVRAEKRAGATWYELAHDRLIKPVRKDNTAWREQNLSTVQRRAALWEREGRRPGLLLAAEELADSETWAAAHAAELTAVERGYLAASAEAVAAARQKQRLLDLGALQARRLRKLGIAALILAAAALAGGGFAGWQWWRAEAAARRVHDLIREGASVHLLEKQPVQAGLVLLEMQAPPAVDSLRGALAVLAGKRDVETLAVLSHEGEVFSASFSPDGKRVVTASGDRTARLWNAATGEPWGGPLVHEQAVHSASFSRDGRQVVTASADGMARVWDAATGRKLFEWKPPGEKVHFASFSPDGLRIVTASSDKTARLWDLAGKLQRELRGHVKGVASAAFSPDGQRLVTASFDHTARLWDVATGQPLGKALLHREAVRSASFSPDGRRVVTASRDGAARVWMVATGELAGDPLHHGAGLRSASFSPDGQWIVTASEDETARVWDAATGQEIAILGGHTAALRSASFSSDGSRVVTASADGTARLWEIRARTLDGEELAVFRGPGNRRLSSAAFSPDGSRIVTASANTTIVWNATLWNAASHAPGEPLTWTSCRRITAAAFSPDGHSLVATCDDGTAYFRDASSGREVAPFAGGSARDASISPDGTRRLTVAIDGTVRLWANPSNYTSFLLGRLRARNKLCLDPAIRRDALGETAEDIERGTRSCQRCVPVFFARLGTDPESRPESYVEAWHAYRGCRKAR